MRANSVVVKAMHDHPILLGYIACVLTAEFAFTIMRALGWTH